LKQISKEQPSIPEAKVILKATKNDK